jgi:hypothetical protein
MFKFDYSPITLVVLAIIITGCMPVATIPTPMPTPPLWITKWLEHPACSPPCWENIQPGITSVDSIQDIVSQYSPNMDVVTKPGNTVVQSVRLFFSLDENLPLSLLISKYGPPDYVRIYQCDSSLNCDTHVLYTKIGMVLSVSTPEIGDWAMKDKVAVYSDTRVIQIYFLKTGLENYYELYTADSHQATPWNGYKEYP